MPESEPPASGTPTPPQTNSDTFWTAAELGSGLIELDRAECLELLAAKSVGRIAYVGDTGPRILPVNYILSEDCVIFRTVPDGEIFRYALNSTCAFEIDETEEFLRVGMERGRSRADGTRDRRRLRSYAVRKAARALGGRRPIHVRTTAV